jgi:hypothetical protein
VIKKKTLIGSVPQDNVYLSELFYRSDTPAFAGGTVDSLSCHYSGRETMLHWNALPQAVEYDVEWVYIQKDEGFSGSTPAQAFAFKEPVRVTVAGSQYQHLVFYDSGTLWYRIRGAGYNQPYPDHRVQAFRERGPIFHVDLLH